MGSSGQCARTCGTKKKTISIRYNKMDPRTVNLVHYEKPAKAIDTQGENRSFYNWVNAM